MNTKFVYYTVPFIYWPRGNSLSMANRGANIHWVGIRSNQCFLAVHKKPDKDPFTVDGRALYLRGNRFNSSPPGQIGRHFADDIFRCIFWNERFCILIKISLKFVPKGPIDNNPSLIQIMACRLFGANGGLNHWRIYTVYPKKYAHGFCFAVLCCGYTLTDFPISIRLTSLALWQSNDCPSASKATLMNMDKYFMWIHYERLHNHNKAKHNKTVCIFLGIYCMQLGGDKWYPWVTGRLKCNI